MTWCFRTRRGQISVGHVIMTCHLSYPLFSECSVMVSGPSPPSSFLSSVCSVLVWAASEERSRSRSAPPPAPVERRRLASSEGCDLEAARWQWTPPPELKAGARAMASSTTDAANDLESYLSLGLTISQSEKKDAEYPKVLWLLSAYLDKQVQRNEELLGSNKIKESTTIFHGHRVPDLSIKLYAERIFKYARCSPSCFVLGLIYMERYLQQPNIYMTSLSVHRLLITSVAVAAKFTDDGFFNNAYYGKVGGISTREMNKLELDLLFSIDFRLKVNLETFRSYCLRLEKEALVLVLEKPIHVQATNGIKHLSFNNSVDDTCKHELVRERSSSQALQGWV